MVWQGRVRVSGGVEGNVESMIQRRCQKGEERCDELPFAGLSHCAVTNALGRLTPSSPMDRDSVGRRTTSSQKAQVPTKGRRVRRLNVSFLSRGQDSIKSVRPSIIGTKKHRHVISIALCLCLCVCQQPVQPSVVCWFMIIILATLLHCPLKSHAPCPAF